MSYKGLFKPTNPAKYRGDPTRIVYRSSWELKVMNYLDAHKDVIQWSSEELFVPYRSPIDNKVHRYFPDFIIRKKNIDGSTETLMLEVKPFKETKPPVKQSKQTKKYLKEVYTWGINNAKWEAAREFCKERKWKFMILTENELGIKF